MKSITLEGKVIEATFAKGSKSEHKAVWLVIDEDTRYKLGKEGGNPFLDDELAKWVGKYVSARGIIYHYSFIIGSYNDIQEKTQDQ